MTSVRELSILRLNRDAYGPQSSAISDTRRRKASRKEIEISSATENPVWGKSTSGTTRRAAEYSETDATTIRGRPARAIWAAANYF